MANGNRFETYVIPGRRGSGEIILNGPPLNLGKKGDLLTIMSFYHRASGRAKKWKPRVLCSARQRVVNRRGFDVRRFVTGASFRR